MRTLGPCQIASCNSDTVQIQFCLPNFILNPPASDTAYTSIASKTIYVVNPSCINEFQWQVDSSSMSNWQNVVDNSTYSGSTNDSLEINGVNSGMNGFRFRCIASGMGVSDTSSETTLYIVDNIGITGIDKIQIAVMPNPNNGLFKVSIARSLIGAEFVLFDESGRMIERGIANSSVLEFDLSDQPKGIYRINISSNISFETMVVIVQ